MFLFGPIGPTELLLILLIVIIIFGARKLPDLGKSLGEGIKNFKKSMHTKEGEDKDKPAEEGRTPLQLIRYETDHREAHRSAPVEGGGHRPERRQA